MNRTDLIFLVASFAAYISLAIWFVLYSPARDVEYFVLTFSTAAILIAYGLVRVNLWWYHRLGENSPLKSLYLFVLFAAAVAILFGILQDYGFSNTPLEGLLFLTFGIAAVFVLRRSTR